MFLFTMRTGGSEKKDYFFFFFFVARLPSIEIVQLHKRNFKQKKIYIDQSYEAPQWKPITYGFNVASTK